MEGLSQEFQLQMAYIQARASRNYLHRNRNGEFDRIALQGYRYANYGRETNYMSDILSNMETIQTTGINMFSQDSGLAHLQTQVNSGHSHNKPIPYKYKCKLCGKDFVTEAGLSSHSMRHCKNKGIRSHMHIPFHPWWCRSCRKSFPTQEQFMEHKYPLVLRNRYPCKTCGKRFDTMTSLTDHKLSHDQEKPFKCNTCGKGYISQRSLSSHKVVHTKGKPFKCDKCIRCYKTLKPLKNHKNKKHPSTEPQKYYFFGSKLFA